MVTSNRNDHMSSGDWQISFQDPSAAVAIIAGSYSIIAGASALFGWALNLPFLTDWTDQGISMFANAAICAALAGAALIVQTATIRLSGLVIARVLAGVVALIAGLTLFEHLTGVNLGIDTLLFDRPWGQSAANAPMRMGPPASISYLILGLALVLTTLGARARIGATILAILTAVIASLSLTGYWFGADQLFGIAKLTGIALNTSTVIAALSIGLMATVPEHGLVAALRRDDAGGEVHRRLVAPIVIVPLVLGWLRILGEQAGLYDAAFGTALRSLTEVILFFGLLWWTANRISWHAAISQKAHARLAAIIESSDDAIVSKSLDGVIETWNAGAARTFGYTTAEAVGKHISLIIPPERMDEEAEILAQLRRGERIEHFETVRVTKDGRRIDVSLSISPLRDSSGNLVGASKIARDITSRRQADIAWRESEYRFSTFMQALPGLAWIKDLQGRYVFVNDATLKPFGGNKQALYGKTDDELFAPETAAQFKANDRDALNTRNGIHVIESLKHADGIHYSIVSKFPIPDADGNPAYIGGVAIDITERMRAEESLRQADKRKDEFLATLAHELRNPLAPIRNAVQLLRMADDNGDIRLSAVEMLERQSSQMVRLIDDLLDVSRISRGKIELRRECIELRSVAEQALETVRPHCDEMRHHLTVEAPPEAIHVNADPIRLAQVIGNLLNNACKFTPRGGTIQFQIQRQGGQAVIRVQDNGIGIAADQAPHVFEMFSQVDNALERSRDGLGIGLSLVKSLIELHGGTVEVHSEGIGRGSEFVVRLPVAEAISQQLEPVPGAAPSGTASRRILVVDDNQDAAASLAMLLKRSGHDVYLAHDGMAAVDSAVSLQPDVVLLDIGLPKLNGYDAGRLIREKCRDRKPLLIALTGWGQPGDRRRSAEAGFDAHLVKPVDFNALAAILQRTLDEA